MIHADAESMKPGELEMIAREHSHNAKHEGRMSGGSADCEATHTVRNKQVPSERKTQNFTAAKETYLYNYGSTDQSAAY
jgi:hypothetical protein